jgi:ABC-2 type transport system ATP-binding protein
MPEWRKCGRLRPASVCPKNDSFWLPGSKTCLPLQSKRRPFSRAAGVRWRIARLGYVPEEAHVYSYLAGIKHLELNAGLRALPDDLAAWKIARLLEYFALTDHRFSPLSQYSRGMKQKILIVAALLHDPELLILDEPFTGLDFFYAAIHSSTLKELRRQRHAILLCSHERNVIDTLCTKVILLGPGLGQSELFQATLRKQQTAESDGLCPALPTQRAGELALKIVETMKAR